MKQQKNLLKKKIIHIQYQETCSLRVFEEIRCRIEQNARERTGGMLIKFLQTHEDIIPILESEWKTEDFEGRYKEKRFCMSIYIYELVDEKNSFGD